MNYNFSDLGRMDSAQFGNLASQSLKANDFYALNMTFSIGRNNSRLFDLGRQNTNMSQVSVGGFKIRKDTAINPNGDIIISQIFDMPKQEDFGLDLDNIMFNNSINVSGRAFNNNLQNSFTQNDNNNNGPIAHDFGQNVQMTSSQEMDPLQKSQFKNLLMTKSINNNNNNHNLRKNIDDIILDQSASLRQMNSNLVSVNLTQFQNETMLRHSNANYSKIALPICLIDKKIETQSEPDYEPKNYDYLFNNNNNNDHHNINNNINSNHNLNNHRNQMNYNQYNDDSFNNNNNNNNTSNSNQNSNYHINNNNNGSSSDLNINNHINGVAIAMNNNNNNIHNNQNIQQNQMKESGSLGMTIEPFQYSGNRYIEQQYAHSDDEQPRKKSPVKFKASNNDEKKAQKGSQYRQSRHKNVFKNFGGTLVRFIVYNQYFQERVIQELQKDAQKQKGFQDWLQTEIKLERKKDFQIAWTTFKSDPDNIKEYKALLRELSRDFFENFSFIYLINSKKISDMEIHLRSIHTYLAAINNPDSLERFKPV